MGNIRDKMARISEGNIGCAAALCKVVEYGGPVGESMVNALINILEKVGIRGSQIYMLWNDACERDTDAFIDLVTEIGNGGVPLQIVRAHLAAGWCAPFTSEEYQVGKKQRASQMAGYEYIKETEAGQ